MTHIHNAYATHL